MALCLLLRLFVFRLLRLKRFSTLTLRCFDLYRYCWRPCFVWKECRSEERFSRNAETDIVCRLLLEKKNTLWTDRLPELSGGARASGGSRRKGTHYARC